MNVKINKLMAPEIQTLFLAMTPLGELRISLPLALVVYKIDWWLAYLISVIGNLIPVIFLLLFLEKISEFLQKRVKIFRDLFFWFSDRTKKRYEDRVRKYGQWALVIFVAIPLPFSGGWTGSLIAFLFGIPFKKAFLLLTLGIALAGVIVLIATKMGIAIEKYFGWPVLIGVLLTIGFIWLIYNIIKSKIKKHEKN